MATTHEPPFDVVATDEHAALADGASLKGADPSELQIISTEALSHLPWQPKKFRYTLVRRPPAVISKDGHWTVDFRLGKVWVTVHPPEGQGRPVMPEELLAARRGWPATATLDRDRLYAVVEKAPGQPIDVATYDMPKATGFLGLIAPNDMAAYLVIGPKASGAGQVEAAHGALAAAGVGFGIDADALRAAIAQGAPGEAFLVARGAEAEVGEDAVLLPVSSHAAPLMRPDGSLDYTASQLDELVVLGEVLLAAKPGKSGAEGRSVRGDILPTTLGREIDLHGLCGVGVAVSEDGTQLIATAVGVPRRLPDQISLLSLLRIQTNLDSSTGNVDFAGNVVIDGDVLDGLTVRASGDITIKGTAQAARLEAGGTIVLRHGMLGGGTGSLQASGDIQTEVLRECAAAADGDIHVSKEIARATIAAGRSVLAGQATIVGGTVTAGHEILAGVVGTTQGALTKLALQPASSQPVADAPSAGGTPLHEHGHARPSVRVHDRIFAPAQISIGILKFIVEHETPYCRFMEDHGTIVVSSFA